MSYNLVDKTTGALTRVAGNVAASGGGGHTIINPSGTAMTQRDNLQFVGADITVTDDSTNGRTIVTSTAPNTFVGTLNEWNALTAEQQKAYDEYKITDDYVEPTNPDAEDIGYDNTTSGLTADDVQDAIDEVVGNKQDAFERISYSAWQLLTPQQQAAKPYYIYDYPSSAITAGNVAYDNTSSGMSADDVQEAVDELKNGLINLSTISTSASTLNDDYVQYNYKNALYKVGVIKYANIIIETKAITTKDTWLDIATLPSDYSATYDTEIVSNTNNNIVISIRVYLGKMQIRCKGEISPGDLITINFFYL